MLALGHRQNPWPQTIKYDRITEELGHGTFSHVCRALNQTTNVEYACKIFPNEQLVNGGGQSRFQLVSSVFSLDLQEFSFILHLPMEVFPFVFCHPLDPVDPCFEDSDEDFLSDFVENVGDRAF
jgi:hypothetical protein